jgi:general secretion pathway protein H
MPRTLPAWQGINCWRPSATADGVILLDVVLALAVAGLLVLAVLPMLSSGTSAPLQEAYAYRVAAILRADRSAAMRIGGPVTTSVQTARRQVFSGANGSVVTLPADVALEVPSDSACNQGQGVFSISFSPDGRSCGGTIRLGRGPTKWRIRINWLTGFVDVVDPKLP